MGKPNLLKNKLKATVVGASLGIALIGMPAGSAFAQGDKSDTNRQERRWDGERNQRNWWGQRWWWHDDEDVDPEVCAERQEDVNAAIERYREKAEAKHASIALYSQSQQEFVVSNNLEVENYDKLSARVDKADSKAIEAVAELGAPEVDCERSERNDDRLVKEAKQPVKYALKRLEHRVLKISHAIVDSF